MKPKEKEKKKSKIVKLSPDVVDYLASKARPFESPNAVLRRLFGLDLEVSNDSDTKSKSVK